VTYHDCIKLARTMLAQAGFGDMTTREAYAAESSIANVLYQVIPGDAIRPAVARLKANEAAADKSAAIEYALEEIDNG
jgi:hypothetical protein